MKKLLAALFFTFVIVNGFSQTDVKPFHFEGKITSVEQWEGEFFIVLKVLNGEIKVGEEVYVWIMTSFTDEDRIDYTGNYEIQADETDIGKIVKISAVKSKLVEVDDSGETITNEIWRLKEINQ
jgi:hypothetical protein